MGDVRLSDPWTWPRRWRRIFIVTLPVSWPLHTIATVAVLTISVALLVLACLIVSPISWAYEKLCDGYDEIKFQWNKDNPHV